MTRIVIILLSISLCACATTQQYLPVSDQSNLTPGNALTKVERQIGFMGSGRSIEISDDGKVVGQIAPGEFLIWQRPAGIFELQIVPKALVVSHPVPLKVDAKSGERYDFEVFWGGTTFKLQKKAP